MPTYIRLTDYKDSDSKEQGFFKSENRYEAKQDDFEKIPGSPVAYWVSDRVKEIFEKSEKLGNISEPTLGLKTGDNDYFLKEWHEVNFNLCETKRFSILEISQKKWFPYNKGGGNQRWYGNNTLFINWYNNGEEIKNRNNSSLQGQNKYFNQGITWSGLTSGNISFRESFSYGAIFDTNKGPMLFDKNNNVLFFLGFLNSNISRDILNILNPTLSYQINDIRSLPIIFPKSDSTKQTIDTLTQECINISKEDWDSRETSWDFRINELIRMKNEELKMKNEKIEDAYHAYCAYWREKFYKLHKNEEELNRLFIDIYELQDELTPEVALKDITILKSESDIVEGELVFDSEEIAKQFISYAVGCMFGRYSLDKEGLQIANLGSDTLVSHMSDETKVSFPIDDDNVIPVLEDDYFGDDIASRVVSFVKIAFGEEHLSANVAFIEKCLGKTVRAYMVKDFYEDHIKRYKKRPIYWMVATPKKGFMSLSYMHRYQSDIFARVQNSYLREYIAKLEATKEILGQTLMSDTTSSKDKKEADKRIKAIEAKLKELYSFDRDVLTHFAQTQIEIDLDDGVKVNYGKFKEILYPIKGMDKE